MPKGRLWQPDCLRNFCVLTSLFPYVHESDLCFNWKTKVLTEVLQGENLNIIDALNAIKATITSLEVIRGDDVGIRNQIEASVAVLSGKGVDVNAEFSRLHRPRRQPRRLDDNPQSMAEIPISTFYDREFKAVLDILIEQYKENLEKCLEKVRSLFTILQPPLRSDHEDDVFNDLFGVFPKNTPDIAAFLFLSLKFLSMQSVTKVE